MITNTNSPKSAQKSDASVQNLLEVAVANGTFKTFTKAVDKAGLSETLTGPGQHTVFAPTDKAFAKLPADRLEHLFKPENKAELASLLNYHIVNGRKTVADVGKWESAKTINGQPAPIKLSGDKLWIDGAEVMGAEIPSSNGMLLGIDKVNFPTVATKH